MSAPSENFFFVRWTVFERSNGPNLYFNSKWQRGFIWRIVTYEGSVCPTSFEMKFRHEMLSKYVDQSRSWKENWRAFSSRICLNNFTQLLQQQLSELTFGKCPACNSTGISFILTDALVISSQTYVECRGSLWIRRPYGCVFMCLWFFFIGFISSGVWSRNTVCSTTDVSKERSAFIFNSLEIVISCPRRTESSTISQWNPKQF